MVVWYIASVKPVCDDVASTSLLITCYDTFIKWLIFPVYHPFDIVIVQYSMYDMRNALCLSHNYASHHKKYIYKNARIEILYVTNGVPQRSFQKGGNLLITKYR